MSSGASRALKVAIIGSGPSGFYSAARLLAQNATNVEIHMYERLPTPHGLVRYGVAPDHPEVKNVEHKFSQVATDKRFRFFGNVNIIGSITPPKVNSPSSSNSTTPSTSYTYPLASSLPISSLLPHYTHILLSYGSSLSRPLGIPGSGDGELYHVHPALDFVNWYNGHPAAHDAEFLASHPWKQVNLKKDLRHATVIGAGNVALDVARILLRSTSTLHSQFRKDEEVKSRASLRETDIPESVLAQLAQSGIRHVDVVARRGPAQVSFTNKELREMMDLQGVHYNGIRTEDLQFATKQINDLDEAMKRKTERQDSGTGNVVLAETRVRKRLLSILEKGSMSDKDSKIGWSTSFFQSPSRFTGSSEGGKEVVKQVVWDEMAFKGLPEGEEQSQPWSASAAASSSHLQKTGRSKSSSTDFVITSVGYKGAPLDASDPIQTRSGLIPWDAKRGVIPNRGGRVLDDQERPIPGLYVSGWLASGPVGVIASTRIDANSIADQMLFDWQTHPDSSSLNIDPLPDQPDVLRQSALPVISWSDWLRLDAEEVRRGKELGKSREKVLSIREMLEIIA
ncbi:hypothetical protein CBS101457_002489 [Exobasidium rhododendri]|nr:hypothetical protein CBS101457_002489 [Exobasidium rhododendri]